MSRTPSGCIDVLQEQFSFCRDVQFAVDIAPVVLHRACRQAKPARSRCVALEGAPYGVSCVMISPTWVETELMRRNVEQLIAREGRGRTLEDAMAEIAAQNPQQRIIQPAEVASLVAYLCRDDAKGITAENIQITGGALW